MDKCSVCGSLGSRAFNRYDDVFCPSHIPVCDCCGNQCDTSSFNLFHVSGDDLISSWVCSDCYGQVATCTVCIDWGFEKDMIKVRQEVHYPDFVTFNHVWMCKSCVDLVRSNEGIHIVSKI